MFAACSSLLCGPRHLLSAPSAAHGTPRFYFGNHGEARLGHTRTGEKKQKWQESERTKEEMTVSGATMEPLVLDEKEQPNKSSQKSITGEEDQQHERMNRVQKTGIMNFVPPADCELFASVSPKLRTMSLQDKCLLNLNFLSEGLKFSSLTILDLSQNMIGDVDILFKSSFPVLKKLNMSKNKVVHLPEFGWENVSSVQEVDVSENSLEALPEKMGCLSRLRVLLASKNCIHRIPDSLAGLPSITDMDFEANRFLARVRCSFDADLVPRLEEFPLSFAANQTLKRVNLQSNRIKTIAREMFSFLLEKTSIERLNTRGNPMDMKQQEGVESYLQRKNLKVIENGEIISFNALDIAKERETGRALLKQKQT
eukprot:755463-Hanusia_phi.AAC.7